MDPLALFLEMKLGLPDAIPEDLELTLEDTPEAQAARSDASILASAAVQLRQSTTLPPRADAWQRFQARAQLAVSAAIEWPGEGAGPETMLAPDDEPVAERDLVAPPPAVSPITIPTPPPVRADLLAAQAATADLAVTADWASPVDSPSPSDSVSVVDLYELCAGNLSDAEAGQIERRLASSPSAQSALPSTAKLVAAMSWLRTESQLESDPESLARFAGRLSAALDAELHAEAGAAVPVTPLSVSMGDHDAAPRAPAVTARGSRSVSSTRLVLAAAVLLACGLSMFAYWQPSPVDAVRAEVATVQSVEQLAKLRPDLEAAVGESLLDLEAVAPDLLANQQLLADIAARGDAEQLGLAKFLASDEVRRIEIQSRAARGSVAVHGFLFGESVARADDGSTAGRSVELDRQLRSAIRRHEFTSVIALASRQSGGPYPLIALWGMVAAGQQEEAAAYVAQVEGSRAASVQSLSARVFLAGVYRSLGQADVAATRLRELQGELPLLAFHLGHLFQFDLLDAARASTWYETLAKSSRGPEQAFGRFGQSLLKQETWCDEPLAAAGWKSVQTHPQAPVVLQPTQQGDAALLDWLHISDRLKAGDVLRGDANWQNYQVTIDVRFGPAETFGRRPRMLLYGYHDGHDATYATAISLSGMQLERREPQPYGGYESVGWPGREQPFDMPLDAGRWYTVKMRLHNEADGVRVVAKIWPRDTAEPEAWLVSWVDLEAGERRQGQIGFSVIDCQASLGWLRVEHFPSAQP